MIHYARILALLPLMGGLLLATGCAGVSPAADTRTDAIKTRLAPAEERRFLHDYARLLIRLERYDQAEDLLAGLRQRQPDSLETVELLAEVYEHQERLPLALEARRQLHRRRPDDTTAAGRYARTALLCGRFEEAEAVFRGWLQQAEPDSPRAVSALNNLGYSALLQGDHRRAADLFKRALAADPLNRRARANLALAYRLDGREEQAREVHPRGDRKGNQTADGPR